MQLYSRQAEAKLIQNLSQMRDAPAGWQAVHFHLNELMEQYKSDYQIKIAVNLIHDLLKDYDGGIYLMLDSSIIVLCRHLQKDVLDKLIFQLRYLYMDDALAYTDAGLDNAGFSTAYDLKTSWKAFFDVASRRMAMTTRKTLVPERTAPDVPPVPVLAATAAEPEKPVEDDGFSASKLANIERALSHADLDKVIRRQPVCAVLPGKPVRRVFDELYIRIAHLRHILKSDVDFLSNRWLFKYLTRTLDERMIELIRRNPARYFETPVSLNLNVETLLSSHFEALNAVVSPQARVSIVLEIPVMDVFADTSAYFLARDEAQKLGYRICLDGLTERGFAAISREKLGFDLIKVQWNADAQSDLNQTMLEAVRQTGTNRVILCRCDNRSAIEYGQAMGISLFQGRAIDSVLNPTAKVEN